MKKLLFIIIMFLSAISINAEQENKKFNPQQFRKDQEACITQNAQLTQQEAAAFFPLFREQQDKQRALFNQQMKLARKRPCSDKEAAHIIEQMGQIELKIAKLKIQYNTKFCRAIPAMKVMRCIKAEEKFKHRVMDNLVRGQHPHGPRPPRPDKK